MANLDDNIENGFDGDDDITAPGSKLSRKKLLLIVVPVVAAIGIFGFYYTSQKAKRTRRRPITASSATPRKTAKKRIPIRFSMICRK